MRALLLAAVAVAALIGPGVARASSEPHASKGAADVSAESTSSDSTSADRPTHEAPVIAGCVVDLERAAFESVVDAGVPLEVPVRVGLCADPSDPSCSSLPASEHPGPDVELAELVRFLDDVASLAVPPCAVYRTLGRAYAPGLPARAGVMFGLERPPHRV